MPLGTRDYRIGAVFPIADPQACVGVVEVGDGVGAMLAVGEEAGGFGEIGAHLDAGLAGYRLAVDADFRRVQAEEGVAAIDVPLPADGEDGVAVLEQETVALGDFGGSDGWSRRAVEEGDGATPAPVDDFDDEPTVAGRRVGRRDQGEVGFKAHTSGVGIRRGPGRSVLQVGDGGVSRVLRINSVSEHAVDALIDAGVAERLAAGVGLTLLDVHCGYGHGEAPRVKVTPAMVAMSGGRVKGEGDGFGVGCVALVSFRLVPLGWLTESEFW